MLKVGVNTEYLFLNDATSGDGAQEYGAIKRLPDTWLQVESITFSWCTYESALALSRSPATLRPERSR